MNMATRVLEFFPHELHPRKGGPYSYLYNLKDEIVKNQQRNIIFLSDLFEFQTQQPSKKDILAPLKKFVRLFFSQKQIINRRIKTYVTQIRQIDERIKQMNFDEFDVIHFHEAVDLWRYKEIFQNYSGKIIFTPHSPVPYHVEMIQEVFKLKGHSIIYPALYRELEEIDKAAFELADLLVLPCREAIEGYYAWPPIQSYLQTLPLHLIPTGCRAPVIKSHCEEVFNKFSLPRKLVKICFIGRHSFIKGYDLLEDAAKEILNKDTNTCFVIAGSPTGIETFQHSKWIQTGWVDDPFSLMNACDVVVVPNRETYFDLNILEAMALGKPIILTETGGSKFLKKFQSPGLFFSKSTVEGLLAAIKSCLSCTDELELCGGPNKKIFEENFTTQIFYKRYTEFYQSI